MGDRKVGIKYEEGKKGLMCDQPRQSWTDISDLGVL